MQQVSKDKVVSIEYTLTDPKGQVIDSSKGRQPLRYLHGAGNIIPGLEHALEGKSTGDNVQVTVPPEQAYGQRNEKLVQAVPRTNFGGVAEVRPGMQFEARTQQGSHVVTVVDVSDQSVTVDANHPLAGMPLNFEVNVVDVRDATADELSHGHVHAPGHQH